MCIIISRCCKLCRY